MKTLGLVVVLVLCSVGQSAAENFPVTYYEWEQRFTKIFFTPKKVIVVHQPPKDQMYVEEFAYKLKDNLLQIDKGEDVAEYRIYTNGKDTIPADSLHFYRYTSQYVMINTMTPSDVIVSLSETSREITDSFYGVSLRISGPDIGRRALLNTKVYVRTAPRQSADFYQFFWWDKVKVSPFLIDFTTSQGQDYDLQVVAMTSKPETIGAETGFWYLVAITPPFSGADGIPFMIGNKKVLPAFIASDTPEPLYGWVFSPFVDLQ